MSRISRRGALAGLAGGLLASAASWAQDEPDDAEPKLRLRRSVGQMAHNDPDLEAYRIAIVKMRRSGAWERQVRIHADMSLRHHSSWRFLPWHRLQLYWLEKQVARLSGKDDFAMPYWDWSDDRAPAVFFDDEVFAMEGREVDAKASIAAFLKANDARLTGKISDDFATFFGKPRRAGQAADESRPHFSGSAEWSGHNLIHGFIGGDMGQLDRSPNDPLFWLHHANVDRAWAAWTEQHHGRGYEDDWGREQLSGYVDPDQKPVPARLAIEVVDTRSLGYGYGLPRVPIAVMAAPPPRRPPRFEDYTLPMTRLSAHKGSVVLPAALGAAQSVTATGFIQVQTDERHAAVLKVRAHGGQGEAFREDAFLTPMGALAGHHHDGVRRYRVELSRAARDAGPRGLHIEVEAGPLAGRRAGGNTTTLANFVVEARARFAG